MMKNAIIKIYYLKVYDMISMKLKFIDNEIFQSLSFLKN